MEKELQHRINAGRVAVEKQTEFFHHHFGRVDSQWKEDDTRVTFADFAISERIFTELRGSFPGDAYCSEESNPLDEAVEVGGGYAWVLDPVDGTNNFALGLTHCAISLALLRGGVPVYGYLYDYSRRTILHGGPRHGLWEGHRRVQPVRGPLQPHSAFGLHFPLGTEELHRLAPLLTTYRVRSLGSGALVLGYAALGLLDGAVDFRVKIWDIAAGHALALGGGAEFHFLGPDPFPLVRFHPNGPRTPYVAGSPAFCAAVREALGR